MRILKVMMTALVLGATTSSGALWADTVAAAGAGGKITVTGEGRVDAAPDMATITLGVTTQALTADVALADNSARVAEVLARLTEAGIEARDVQTSGLSLNPQFNYDSTGNNQNPEITGYIASNTVTVRVRDLPSVGGVLDTVVKSGANTFNGLVFGLSKPEPVMDEARKAAVVDGIRKATLFAQAAGVTLGPILSLSESSGYTEPQPMFRMADSAAGGSVPVASGELGVTATVTIEFAIAE